MNKLSVNYPWLPDKKELYRLFDDILERRELTNNSKYVKLLEQRLGEKTGVPYVFATCNGTIALQLAIRALGITDGEIITTPHSFVASASSIIWQNCRPVFADIEPDTLCINPHLIEDKITERTKAILAVHIYGSVSDVDAIEEIARKNNLMTIYDGSHAMGVTYKNKSVFNYGTISTVSLHISKIVSSIEGGAIFCNDKARSDTVYKLRYFGKNTNNQEEMAGINGKMDEFNAAFGILSLANLDNEMAARNTVASRYQKALSSKPSIQLVNFKNNTSTNYSYFPIILNNEADVHKLLENARHNNVHFRRYWYPSLTTLPFLSSTGDKTPVSDSISRRIVCAPIHQDLSEDDQNRVITELMRI